MVVDVVLLVGEVVVMVVGVVVLISGRSVTTTEWGLAECDVYLVDLGLRLLQPLLGGHLLHVPRSAGHRCSVRTRGGGVWCSRC